MYFRKKVSGGRTYLQIVESRREGDQVRQQGYCHARSCGRTPGKRSVGTIAPLRRAVRRQGHGAERGV